MKAKLAFYKGKGTFVDKLIRIWTKSKYSHVELVYGKDWYSISPRENEVRSKVIEPKEGHWDFVEVDIDEMLLINTYYKTAYAEYDWWGIIASQIIPLNKHNEDKWFCSEWCAEVLGFENANQFSPQDLYETVTKENK